MRGDEAHAGGYRSVAPGGAGPALRSDIVDVHVFRLRPSQPHSVEFLQLLRASDPLGSTWQPIMGHAEPREHGAATALRELREEADLTPRDPAFLGFWALEQVHPYYIAAINCVVLSPRFVVQAAPAWEPTLNIEHSAHRWVIAPRSVADTEQLRAAEDLFMWPGQKRAIEEILHEIVRPASPARERLRIDPARMR